MVLVKKTKNKSVQKMIAEFKRKVRDAGIKELEERRYYTKPSQLRREREKKIIRARKNL